MSTRVLIVDDDLDLLELISFNLVEEGYEVTVARNGTEALNAARIGLPDLVLLDVKLDGLDGYTVCQMLKALPSTSTIPIMLVTGMKAHLDRRKGMLAGATDYITKPFAMKDLIQRVRAVLPTAWAC